MSKPNFNKASAKEIFVQKLCAMHRLKRRTLNIVDFQELKPPKPALKQPNCHVEVFLKRCKISIFPEWDQQILIQGLAEPPWDGRSSSFDFRG